MINVNKLESYYITFSIKEHKKIKNKLLTLLKKIPNTKVVDRGQVIRNTDVIYGREMPREYLEYFWKIINPYMVATADRLLCESWQIDNGWFQQYVGLSYHDWHMHAQTTFAAVYFLELPDPDQVTEFIDLRTFKKIKDIKVKEGDVLMFPSNMAHRSSTTLHKKRRTVIAFNCSFDNLNETKLNEKLNNEH